MFLHMRLIFWLAWPRGDIAAGWAFPWENDVLALSCSEVSLDLMRRNSNNNEKNSGYIEKSCPLENASNQRERVLLECLPMAVWEQAPDGRAPGAQSCVGFGAAAAAEQCPRRGGSASRPQRDRLPAVCRFPRPQDGISSTWTALRSCRALQAARAAAPGLRGLTNPPVRGNEGNLARGESSHFWDDQML